MRSEKQLTEYLENYFAAKGLPGVSVCLRGPGGYEYARGFGMRSIEKQLPVNPDTVFGIASMSKSFTTLACCILAVEGKMSLDDPMVKYFPTLHIPGVPDELVTVRQMGMHRSSIPAMEPLEWSIAMNTPERDSEWRRICCRESPNRMDKIEQIVDYISEGRYPALGEPGEYMSYCNEGYALLSYVVDMAAGMSLEQFLDERIFTPLGMSRSILDVDCSGARERCGADNITSLFERGEQNELIEDDNWSILPPFRGCACIKTTAPDVTRYYKMLADGGVYEGRRIIPAEAVELLCGLEYPLRKKPFYCLGLYKQRIGGKMVCQHSGGLHGVSTVGGFVEGGWSFAALCSEGDVDMDEYLWALVNYILELPLDTQHYWAVPCGRRFSAEDMLVGDYVGHEGVVAHVNVLKKDGALMCRMNGSLRRLEYCESTVFASFNPETGERMNTLRFYIQDGRSWAVKNGSRIFRRV